MAAATIDCTRPCEGRRGKRDNEGGVRVKEPAEGEENYRAVMSRRKSCKRESVLSRLFQHARERERIEREREKRERE
jgi:hypothetical protein